MNQEWIALVLVGLASLFLLKQFFSFALAPFLSRWFLKRGKVSLAMRLKGDSHSCGGCGTCGK